MPSQMPGSASRRSLAGGRILPRSPCRPSHSVRPNGPCHQNHRGLRAAFSHLAHGDPAIGAHLTRFLGDAYEMKAIADYATEPETGTSASKAAEAAEVIETASHLVENIVAILGPEDPDPIAP
jgi:hypothetical protein